MQSFSFQLVYVDVDHISRRCRYWNLITHQSCCLFWSSSIPHVILCSSYDNGSGDDDGDGDDNGGDNGKTNWRDVRTA